MLPTMMIVDDIEMNRAMLKRIFQGEFCFLEAESSEEAIALLQSRSEKIGFLILDLSMEGMSGIDLLKKFGKEPYLNGVPVAVVTSSDKIEDQLGAFDVGASEFITKPFDPKVIRSRVHAIWATAEKLRESEHEKALLKEKSERDAMTGLLNKPTAQSIIGSRLSEDSEGIHALLMIDIDNFKGVNDKLGHLNGDNVIRIVAKTMRERFRESDVLARFGGDEFCVFMHNLPSPETARNKAQALSGAIQMESDKQASVSFSVSIGLAFSNREHKTREELFRQADEALYRAKNAGKSCVCEYDSHTSDTITIKEVKEDAAHFRALLNLLPVGVGILYAYPDGKMRFGYFNDAFYRMMGETRAERRQYIGETFFESVHPEDKDASISEMRSSLEENRNGNTDVRICRRDGSYKWYNAQCAKIEATDEYTMLYITLVDISHLK